MTRTELVAKIAKETGANKTVISQILYAFSGAVIDELKGGGRVAMVGFGSFYSSKHAEKNGRNPHTGAIFTVKARRIAKFKESKDLLN